MATKGVNPFAKMPIKATTKAPTAAGPKAAAKKTTGNPFAVGTPMKAGASFKAGGKAKC
jgi:hypothetical protein